MKKRYVNIYNVFDENKNVVGRDISDKDWQTRGEAETFPILDRELVIETVRLLSKEEEEYMDGVLKLFKETHPALLSEVFNILSGINKTETEQHNGWWETSVGAEFGRGIQDKIKLVFEKYFIDMTKSWR
jgi:hypothetical protein